MRNRSRLLWAARWLCLLLLTACPPAMLAQGLEIPAGSRFVMSHFKGDGGGGDEKLYVSVSPDGLNWTALNDGLPVWQPPGAAAWGNVVRDPTIVYAKGYYWVAFTSGNYGSQASFGLVKSQDLVNWTFVQEVSTLTPGATDTLTWNPCFFKDGDGSVHVFVSISPTNGSVYHPLYNMRTYEMHPLNDDFTEWSQPVPVKLPSTNTNEFWAWKEGPTYHAIYVDFAQNANHVHVTSNNLVTGWGNARTFGFPTQEGGFVLKRPEGGYRLYLEPGNGAPVGSTYRWCDINSAFTSWGAQQPVQGGVPMRNGKIAALAGGDSYSRWQSVALAAAPPGEREPEEDPDKDGSSNAEEYGHGSDPLDNRKQPHGGYLRPGSGVLEFSFQRVPARADVALLPEFSKSLQSWTTIPPEEWLSRTLLTTGAEEIRLEMSSEEPRLFLRVRATLAE